MFLKEVALSSIASLSLFQQAGVWMCRQTSLDCVDKGNSLGLANKQSERSLDSQHWQTATLALECPHWVRSEREDSNGSHGGAICPRASMALTGDSGTSSIWSRNSPPKYNLTLSTHLHNRSRSVIGKDLLENGCSRGRSDFLSIYQSGTLKEFGQPCSERIRGLLQIQKAACEILQLVWGRYLKH